MTDVDIDVRHRPGIAHLSAYEIVPRFGGAEEGGWWYNAYVHLGAVSLEAEFIEEHLPEDDWTEDNDGRILIEIVPLDQIEHNASVAKMLKMFHHYGARLHLTLEGEIKHLENLPRPRYE